MPKLKLNKLKQRKIRKKVRLSSQQRVYISSAEHAAYILI